MVVKTTEVQGIALGLGDVKGKRPRQNSDERRLGEDQEEKEDRDQGELKSAQGGRSRARSVVCVPVKGDEWFVYQSRAMNV